MVERALRDDDRIVRYLAASTLSEIGGTILETSNGRFGHNGHQIRPLRDYLMAFDAILALCIKKWTPEVALLPPVSEAEVRRAWASMGKHVADDVVRLYTTIGGFDDDWDAKFFWTLWPLDLICDANSQRPGDGGMFCDHSIQVVNWEVRFEDKLTSSVWNVGQFGVDRPEMTAPSLEMFFRLYLHDPWQLMDAWDLL